MTEKKIDLSNVVVGQKLWSAERGECFVTLVGENTITTGCIPKFSRYDKNGIVSGTTNTVPTLFHSREEFLEFHNIAPVRMTRKEIWYRLWDDDNLDTGVRGFIIAGGQIIEESKNLPCPVCGCNIPDDTYYTKDRVCHPKSITCFMSNLSWNKYEWNDESKRRKV